MLTTRCRLLVEGKALHCWPIGGERSGQQAAERHSSQQIHKAKQVARRSFTAEDKIRIVMEGIRGEESISAIAPSP